jgi:DNA repair exonuclease SbcCD ATPase subunit
MRVVILRKQVGTGGVSVDALLGELKNRVRAGLEGLENMSFEELLDLAEKLNLDVSDIKEQIEAIREAARNLPEVGGPSYGRLSKQIMEEEENSLRAKADGLAAAAKRLAGLLSSCSSWDDLANLPSATKREIVETAETLRRLLDELESAFTTLDVYGSTYWDRIRPREWGGEGPSLEEIGRSDR